MICESLQARGRTAKAFASADEIASLLAGSANSGELVLIMSNGGFDGLTAKLLEKMKTREGVRG
jgi:UDP-N-acetylmuramate: L-alanyl-gamma-D-glutamyl-meso-diaminopimelate ligase